MSEGLNLQDITGKLHNPLTKIMAGRATMPAYAVTCDIYMAQSGTEGAGILLEAEGTAA